MIDILKSVERLCDHCGTPLKRKIYKGGRAEALAPFKKRKTCSRKCTGLLMSISEKKNNCDQCHKPLIRRSYADGRTEPSANFRKRKFCNSDCYALSISGKNHWKPKKAALKTPVIPIVIAAPDLPLRLIPSDATHKNECGIFKKVGKRWFRHDGFGWVVSNNTNSKYKIKPIGEVA
ncbi:hypothetical protein [Neptunomonas japonica]|uniref:hypothetical protein n=1 Tax=Neptunomonas japonica TaxID=417574 RepID=UPI001916C8B2|nr:hypothetical protein [Neptunomonas japonica]